MPGDDEIQIETAFRTFRVQVHRFPVPLTNAQRDDAQRLALAPVRLRRPDATLETQRFFQRLREFLEWYQSARGLTVDGKAGSETRTALIKEYMSLDDTSLDDDSSAAEDAA